MPSLKIYGIDPRYLTIDDQRVAPVRRDPTLLYVVAPPEEYIVPAGQHALRYDVASEEAARGVTPPSYTLNGVTTPVPSLPIAVRVLVPDEGLTLRRLDHWLVDERGIQTPTGYTGLVCPPHEHDLTGLQKTMMVVGAFSFATLVYHWFTDEK